MIRITVRPMLDALNPWLILTGHGVQEFGKNLKKTSRDKIGDVTVHHEGHSVTRLSCPLVEGSEAIRKVRNPATGELDNRVVRLKPAEDIIGEVTTVLAPPLNKKLNRFDKDLKHRYNGSSLDSEDAERRMRKINKVLLKIRQLNELYEKKGLYTTPVSDIDN